jgi:[acyl-carrier-protein] S-malonyltransferase
LVALLFPGQGSQAVGMGADLATRFPQAREVFAEADDALGFALSDLAWHGPESELTATHNAQPALLTHSVAVYRVLESRLGEVGVLCAAGHSLGEFSAHVAAGTLAFADAVRLVRRRGELMFRGGQERPGTMAAVLSLDPERLAEVCAGASTADEVCVPANYNAPGQVVISGDIGAVERAEVLADRAGARRVIRLNVSGAFHSPLMATAEAGLAEALAEIGLRPPAVPVVANVDAEPVRDAEAARHMLVRQLTAPVRWDDCVRTMRRMGAVRFLELGPGQVLTGLLKRIDREAIGQAIGNADEVERVLTSLSTEAAAT